LKKKFNEKKTFFLLIFVFCFIIFSCSEKDEYKSFEKYGASISSFTSIPDNFSVSSASNTATLSWNSVDDATSYTIFWNTLGEVDSNDSAITSITNNNYTHSNLENGSRYYYKVAAVSKFYGTGTLSSEASAIISSNIQGSETYNFHTYALTSSTMNWQAAADAASAVGGYLTVLNTLAENEWLYAKFGNYGGTNRDLWIGALDNVTEGSWYWYTGTTSGDGGVTDNISSGAEWPDGSSKWASGEPNNVGDEDCGTIRGSIGTDRWNDYRCTNTYYGIIELE
tara:strand:+ start:122 stop:967 length:846 start_codon:yes stop_codon:yes gene_type:complete